MNIQARFGTRWQDMGEVTHVEAARRYADERILAFVPTIIQTRDTPTAARPKPPIFEHRVTRRVVFDVVPLRGDEK